MEIKNTEFVRSLDIRINAVVSDIVQYKPAYEIKTRFVLRNLILQTRMRSHPVGLDSLFTNIGIKHDFPFINIRKVPRVVLKTEGEARGFQHFPRYLANVNEWQNHVWSLLLHKFKENTPKIEKKMFEHFILQPYQHFLTCASFL